MTATPAGSAAALPWPRRALVTGAAGFIGRAVTAALREAGVEVVGLDTRGDAEAGVLAGDICEPSTWQDAVAACELVVHTAAVVSNAVDAEEQWRVNVLGTKRVLDAAVAAGASRFVLLSSVRAFSDAAFPDQVGEDFPVRPDGNPYVDMKIAGEQVALQAHASRAIDVVVVRPADVYGPGSRPWVLEPLEMIRSRQFVLPAMGRGLHSPVYIDDLVRGLLLAARHPAAPGQVFTLTGPRAVPCSEYFGHLAVAAGRRPPIAMPTVVAVGLAAASDRLHRLARRRTEANPISVRYLARTGTYSGAKARDVLGYRPEVDLDEGMARTRAWLRSQGLGV